MCEIAVIDPEQAPISAAHQIAAKFHEEQGDGLGVLAVLNRGGHFEYRRYKSIHPHWQTLYNFFRRHYSDAYRIVIHGRASTCGNVNREAAHPIQVDCDCTEFEHVVHNGSVRKHRNIRSGLISQGHTFNTKVDSEILAHKVQELPDTVEDHTRSTYDFRGNLNYLLFSENGIFVRVSQKYHLTDDFTMTCSLSAFDDAEDLGFERGSDNEWMLIKPDGADVDIETKERRVWKSGSKYNGQSNGVYGTNTGTYRNNQQNQRNVTTTSSSTHTETYTDHADFDYITAIQVAPGVMKIIDNENGSEEYVWREEEPRLYFWYAPEPEPDNIEYLEELAERGKDISAAFVDEEDQSTLEDFPNQRFEEAIVEETTNAVQETVDDLTIDDVAEVQEEIREAVKSGQAAIQGTIGG